MKNVELVLNLKQIDHVEDALVMYIGYLKDGDVDDKKKAKQVERTYSEIYKQTKWYPR